MKPINIAPGITFTGTNKKTCYKIRELLGLNIRFYIKANPISETDFVATSKSRKKLESEGYNIIKVCDTRDEAERFLSEYIEQHPVYHIIADPDNGTAWISKQPLNELPNYDYFHETLYETYHTLEEAEEARDKLIATGCADAVEIAF